MTSGRASPPDTAGAKRTDSRSDGGLAGGASKAHGDTGTRPREIGGRGGADPTRYGDWEKKGRCIDF